MPPTDTRATQEQVEGQFRESLKDATVIIEKLAPHVASVEELVAVLRLAQENDTQLRLVLKEVTAPPPSKR